MLKSTTLVISLSLNKAKMQRLLLYKLANSYKRNYFASINLTINQIYFEYMAVVRVLSARFFVLGCNLMSYRLLIVLAVLVLSSCSSWIYRIDIPQGNYLEQKDIDKLQLAMTKEQVRYILGSPVVVDSFNDDTWHYVYSFKSGRSDKFNSEKRFTITFKDNKLIAAEGDFKLPESFYTPIQQ